jgi:hypothetical protein
MTFRINRLKYGVFFVGKIRLPRANVRKYVAQLHNVMFWGGENEASQDAAT